MNYIVSFPDIDKSMITRVGGKGTNLGELTRISDIEVPPGFCITTEAYKALIRSNNLLKPLIDQLADLTVTDREAIHQVSATIRDAIEATPLPQNIIEAITRQLQGTDKACAIRSSATMEDLPNASFAGQQDSYLNIIGTEAILRHISKCWASLFTERAVTYRIQNGFDHHQVRLAVVVQQMVFPEAAGVLFTADPVSGHRKTTSIDAGFGLGEALVSGIVNADHYKVRNGNITEKKIAEKQYGIYALKEGGTQEQNIVPTQQQQPALTDEQVVKLAQLGRRIEAHFGAAQDIEWCLADGRFYIVQSRPITTLYPVPKTDDTGNHVYLSVGYQQMMTDAMKPLGLSIWQLTNGRTMHQAGGRLFVDISTELSTASGRNIMLNVLGKSDPLLKDALQTLFDRGDFISTPPEMPNGMPPSKSHFEALNDYEPAVVDELIRRSQTVIQELKQQLRAKTGVEIIDYIQEDAQRLRQFLADPQSIGVIMTGMNALAWINEKMQEWLGEKNAGDAIAQSVPNNITSEMGLELLDVADIIRPYPELIAYLQQTKESKFLEELARFNGGDAVKQALTAYLDKYGMRCTGEIDITRTRWAENPAQLLPLILSNIHNFQPGEAQRRFRQGLQEAQKKERELLQHLQELPAGEQKVTETQRMIRLVRTLTGYREYPKYHFVNRYFIYKQALLAAAAPLVEAGLLPQKEAIYSLSFEELATLIRERQPLPPQLLPQREAEYRAFEKLAPPRILTSDGEIINGHYRRDHLPADALVGLPVSTGIIEGRARVLNSMETARLEEGDILVTTFTDPSWTPLFVSIKGLVTEVGGLMTHGAVIAREYGIPAVVGVAQATRLIKNGQRIRVNGTEGYIELL